MRITLSIPDSLEKELKEWARKEKRSFSAFVTSVLEEYLREKKRKSLGYKLLDHAGKVHVAQDIHQQLKAIRKEHDRS